MVLNPRPSFCRCIQDILLFGPPRKGFRVKETLSKRSLKPKLQEIINWRFLVKEIHVKQNVFILKHSIKYWPLQYSLYSVNLLKLNIQFIPR